MGIIRLLRFRFPIFIILGVSLVAAVLGPMLLEARQGAQRAAIT